MDFSTIGKVSNEIGFIDTAVVRTYSVNEAGEEVTAYFFRENQFIVDLESYYSRKPSKYPLQAVITTRINYVKRQHWKKSTEKILQLFILTKSLSEALLLNSASRNTNLDRLGIYNSWFNCIGYRYKSRYKNTRPNAKSIQEIFPF